MASPAQQLANQANAQKSTGPKTAEGKANASKNATTHGLSGGVLQIPAAHMAHFRQFEADLTASAAPRGALEIETCRQLARAAWNLRRLRFLHRELAAKLKDDPFFRPEAAAELRRLARYRATLEMNFFRSMRTLRDLQTRRVSRELQLHEPESAMYPPNIEPKFYAKLPNTKGDRALALEARGLIGPNITHTVFVDEQFQVQLVPVHRAPSTAPASAGQRAAPPAAAAERPAP